MKRLLKNKKGFTLVELMMVIAVIGILAAVLIPKMGFLKDTAKEAGIDSNMRTVEATINSMIFKYTTTDIGGKDSTFDTALKNKLNEVMKNPFSGSDKALYLDDIGSTAPAVATYNGSYSSFNSTEGGYTQASGSVICAYRAENGRIKVDLFYIDKNGTKSPDTTLKTIE